MGRDRMTQERSVGTATAVAPPHSFRRPPESGRRARQPSAPPPAVAAVLAAPREQTAYERWGKPALDRAAGLLLLLACLPVMLAVALAVRLRLGSPVLFRQARVGRGGEVFHVYKFRSMSADRRTSPPSGWDGIDRRVVHKSADDPRLSPLGRFLRGWSLDELPQLLNVVAGHMSLVGPRPEMVAIVERYAEWQHRRHAVKPGVTGLWQVSERGNGMMHEHTEVDLAYLQRITLVGDLRLILLTIPAALGMHRGF